MARQPAHPGTQARPAAAGLGAGTMAGMVWGLAFLIPVLLTGWSAVAVTTGRYLACGLFSAVLLLVYGAPVRRMARGHWRPALIFALTGNVGYYLLLVVGIHAIGAPVTDLVIGCIPVAVAVSANLASRTYPWRRLLLPVMLVAIGLLIVNTLGTAAGQLAPQASPMAKAVGLLAAIGAMLSWTCYGLANARFLAAHPEVAPASWSIVVGAATGVITLVALPFVVLTHQFGVAGEGGHSLLAFAAASIVLGVVVSWGGTWLWNAASIRLPTATAGMLINVETLAGFSYVYAAKAQWPPMGQILGFVLISAGVVLIVRLQRRTTIAPPPAAGDERTLQPSAVS